MAQILKANLKAIGLELEIVQFPTGDIIFQKLATEGHLFDIGRIAFGVGDHTILNSIFHGGTIGQPGNGNWSYFNSTKYTVCSTGHRGSAATSATAPTASWTSGCRETRHPRFPSRSRTRSPSSPREPAVSS